MQTIRVHAACNIAPLPTSLTRPDRHAKCPVRVRAIAPGCNDLCRAWRTSHTNAESAHTPNHTQSAARGESSQWEPTPVYYLESTRRMTRHDPRVYAVYIIVLLALCVRAARNACLFTGRKRARCVRNAACIGLGNASALRRVRLRADLALNSRKRITNRDRTCGGELCNRAHKHTHRRTRIYVYT